MTQALNRKLSNLLRNQLGKLLVLFIGVTMASPALQAEVLPGLFFERSGKALVFPVMAPRLSSKFGKRHHPIRKVTRHHSGVDLAAPRGAQIRSVAGGRVVFADRFSHYGNLVVIEHPDGVTSHYGHCESLMVSPGDLVKAGQIIATVGSTGLSTGPHLHFEIRKDGKALDPEKHLPALNDRASG